MASTSDLQLKVTRENWLEDHPKFKEIQSYGYFDEKSSLARAAMTVYLDLCENKHWFGVCIRPCESLKLVYITGKRTKKTNMDVVVPLTIDTALTLEEIQNIIQEVNLYEEEEVKDRQFEQSCENRRVTIGFCEADSTVVYYDFYQGLVPPDPPNEEEEKQEETKPKRKRTTHKKKKSSEPLKSERDFSISSAS